MHIRFVSTLTPEDEDRLAETILQTAKGLLSTLPIGYLLRVETTGMKVFEHNRVEGERADVVPLDDLARARVLKKL